jgi:LPS-assembly protein
MRPVLALVLSLLLALPATAQEQAALVADRVEIAGDNRLIADGNVEVFYKGRRLRAARITYDATADRLEITGPIVLTDAAGTIVLADQAALSADLSEGILTSARLVLDQQLQLASAEILRIGGRYTRLGRTVASSCKVCAGDPTPLWEIRARRVVHDELERQLYFDNAQVRIAGVPVFWIPRLRMPDPTRKRATGFLVPEVRSTSQLGPGLRIPYFIAIGDSRDVTLTPFVSTRGGRTLELRYRQAFATGWIDLRGAVSRDRIRPGDTRGYALGTGSFALPRGFRLDFSAETVSDRGYLLDYGLGERDRLTSRLDITRVRRDEWISGSLLSFRSLREGEDNDLIPSVAADVTWQRRFRPALIGGVGTLTFSTHGHSRRSSDPADTNGDGIADGRDVTRASLIGEWRREVLFGPGIQAAALADLRADLYDIREDALFAGSTTRVTGAAGVELRWPLVRGTAGGAQQVIEPVVQLIWAPSDDDAVPNEDSVLAEFDEGNLFSLSRLPGNDAIERGARANIGVSFTHFATNGTRLGLTFGRVIRAEAVQPFSDASGLAGGTSDWLAAVQWSRPGLTATGRLVFDEGFALSKSELRLDVMRDRFGVAGSYVWMQANPFESRSENIEELLVDARFELGGNWTGQFSTRYDFAAERAASAGLKLAWRNECMSVDLSLSRRFTSSTSVQPTTDVGLSVQLLGFGGAASPGPARACRS